MGQDILLVDDEPDVLDALEALFEFEGYAIRRARDGIEALAQVAATRPRLIVLDLMMPRMDGYTFVAELERRNLRQGVPILILTADKRAQEKAQEIGAEAGVAKPFEIAALLNEVARLMR